MPPHSASELATMRAQASITSDVVDAGFHMFVLPHTMLSAEFQKKTAAGKLKAVIMPTLPTGFQHSSSVCPLRSDGSTWPLWRRGTVCHGAHEEREG
jgi:hypothetical protein